MNSYAQIQEVHSFDNQSSVDVQLINLENSGPKIVLTNLLDSVNYQYVFYNTDYSVFKTVNIDLETLFAANPFHQPALDINYVAENLFDQDGDIDLLGSLTYYNSSDDLYAQVLIFNEDGSVLFSTDIDNTNAFIINPTIANSSLTSSLIRTPDGVRMILDVFYINGSTYQYDVYSLPGSLPSNVPGLKSADELSENSMMTYPNPAHEYVDINYRLSDNQQSGTIQLMDNQGKIIQQIQVNRNQGVVRMLVPNSCQGLYYYKLNSQRGIPRTGKVVIIK